MLEVRIQFLIFVGALIISAIVAGLIAVIMKGRDTRKRHLWIFSGDRLTDRSERLVDPLKVRRKRTPTPYEEGSILDKESTR